MSSGIPSRRQRDGANGSARPRQQPLPKQQPTNNARAQASPGKSDWGVVAPGSKRDRPGSGLSDYKSQSTSSTKTASGERGLAHGEKQFTNVIEGKEFQHEPSSGKGITEVRKWLELLQKQTDSGEYDIMVFTNIQGGSDEEMGKCGKAVKEMNISQYRSGAAFMRSKESYALYSQVEALNKKLQSACAEVCMKSGSRDTGKGKPEAQRVSLEHYLTDADKNADNQYLGKQEDYWCDEVGKLCAKLQAACNEFSLKDESYDKRNKKKEMQDPRSPLRKCMDDANAQADRLIEHLEMMRLIDHNHNMRIEMKKQNDLVRKMWTEVYSDPKEGPTDTISALNDLKKCLTDNQKSLAAIKDKKQEDTKVRQHVVSLGRVAFGTNIDLTDSEGDNGRTRTTLSMLNDITPEFEKLEKMSFSLEAESIDIHKNVMGVSPFNEDTEELKSPIAVLFNTLQTLKSCCAETKVFVASFAELDKAMSMESTNRSISGKCYLMTEAVQSFHKRFINVDIYDKLKEENRVLLDEMAKMKADKDEVLHRLPKVAGARLTDNNPNIADLSDPNRPTRLAEQYLELYDSPWTDAFETLNLDERSCINFLLQILVDCYKCCGDISVNHQQILKRVLCNPVDGMGFKQAKKSKSKENSSTLSAVQSRALSELRKQGADLSVRSAKEAIQLKAKVIESLNEKILPLTDVHDIENELVNSEEYSLDLEIKLRNLQLFGKKEVTQTQEVENSNSREPLTLQGPFSDMNFQHTASFASSSSQFYRLPKLTIPTFNGDILKWQTFWDYFESTVHANINLTDVQKFSYLQSQLEGDAARVIEGFPLTNANYGKAVELLQERFGQKCKVIHAYMQSLLQLSPPSSNIHSLRNFYDKMEAYIRGLESLGQAQDSFGNLLVPVVIGKLPADIRRQLAREHSDGNWMLQDLRMAIFREINILEAGNATEFSQSSMLQSTASFLTNTYNQTSTDAHVRKANHQNGTGKNSKKCAFCEEQHFTNDCTKIVGYSERIDIVKKKKLCYNCLGNHQVSKCKSTKRCRTCKRKHHTSICNPRNNVPEQNGTTMSTTPVNAVLQENEATFQLTSAQQLSHVVLKTAVAPVCSSMYCVDTNILFDEGAQRSFITEKLATTLQLTPDGTEVVKLATFGDTAKNVRNLDTATVYVKTDSGEKIPIKVLIVPMIATPLSNRYRRSVTSLTYLRGLKLAHPVSHDDSFDISLLIGADNYWSFVQEKIIRGDGPTAVQSKLGYLLSGPLPHCDAVTTSDHVQTITSTHIQGESECNLERFWHLESMGISDPTDEPEKTKITEYQQHAITFSDGKYTAKLPWKPDHPALPSNYNVTKRRTENTIRRLRREPEILKKYGEIITEQKKRGFIEQIEDLDKPQHPVHYLPHHPVKKESATTPIRIVYDCSCRESKESPSLNDCLESTPPKLNDLTSIIMRFRYHRYAVSTDIEKAFLQIRLDEKDRDVTRFLWLTDASNPDSSLTTYRFRSVLFGATCSPFILNATILKHLSDNPHIPVAELLQRDIYVDNILSSLETEEDVLSYYRESRALMTKAGFNLRSWTSNSSRLKNLATKEGVCDSDSTVKTLGMRWSPESDTLQFSRPTFRIPIANIKKCESFRIG